MIAGMLSRIGLTRPELRAWALYDWANSTFMTTVIAAVFPIYYQTVAAADLDPPVAAARFATTTTIGLAIVAVVAPVLGAMADYAAVRKRMLGSFLAIGVIATACMFFIQRGDWLLASLLFVLGNIGVTGSFVFYDSLLPHVARQDELDRVSASGYALGYVGGGLLLAINLLWIQQPEWFGIPGSDMAARLSFLSVAVWWLGFSIPLFRHVPEPPRQVEADERPDESTVRTAFRRLGETFRELRGYRQASLMLVAFMIYNDGIQSIIRLATTFGTEIGLPQGALIAAILITQFVGIPFAILFGMLASRIGARRAIYIGLGAYVVITSLAYFVQTTTHFIVLALLVGMVQGGTQALSRSLFATLVPRHKSAEFFGFFGVFEKFAGIFGPSIFAIVITITGSSRSAILSVILFFIVGGALLTRVNLEEGQRAAREAEAGVRQT